jgi:LmbE family N-acetylglucosaminyl deacetylase
VRDYADYISAIVRAYDEAKALTPSHIATARHRIPSDKSGTVLVLAPHPDDEMIVGALPLRLMRQCSMRVVVVAVTLGSKRERQLERFEELRAACSHIGFEAQTLGSHGLENITPEARIGDPAKWEAHVGELAETIRSLRPFAVFYPHAHDANRTHKGVHLLAEDALAKARWACACFETEFWAPMQDPTLMVESTQEDVALLTTALSLHVGEVCRNPYHLRLAAWMMDNVRRGTELVGGQGEKAPKMLFGTLYGASFRDDSGMKTPVGRKAFLATEGNPSYLLSRQD